MYLKLGDFNKKFLTAPVNKITTTPKHILPANLYLPVDSVVHFISDSDQVIGVDGTNVLLRNSNEAIYTYQITDLIHTVGSPTRTNLQVTPIVRQYQKSHLNVKPITNLDRSLSNNHAPIVLNYSLLPRLYKYPNNSMVVYHEWFNIRATLWDMINQIGTRRTHFICYQIPNKLPAKAELIKYAKSFNSSGLSDFHTNDSFNILELWRMISMDVDSPEMKLSESSIEHIKIVFIESGVLTIVNLFELIEWAKENHEQAAIGIYNFLDNLIGLRSPVDTKELDTDSNISSVPDPTIVKLIKEQGSIGALSEAEQKGLIKLSQKYKTIEDPKGSGLTLDKLVVTPEDLKIEKTKLIGDTASIHDKSMLHSTLQEMDEKYIKDVLHKDIVQSVLNLHKAGIIVKDIKVKPKNTAATKSDTYSVSLQPINGAASTIHFTIPQINPDGTFLAGGVLCRCDRQIGSLPIVKTKSDTVSLTSYYGKIFVTRNDSVAANYSKWILKEIFSRSNDKSDTSITDLVYGINRLKDLKVPRAYSAICETIDSFTVNEKYVLIFKYSKINELFTSDEIHALKGSELIPCGRELNTNAPLGMDINGIVYKYAHLQFQELGTVPYIIDSDIGDGPIEYTEMSILNKRISIGLALAYMYGLNNMLDMLNIKYTLSPTTVRLPYSFDEIKIKFKDIIYVVNVKSPRDKLLVGGFTSLKGDLAKYRGSDFNKQSAYGSLLSGSGITTYHLRELKLMWDMFIEPITLGLLTEMNEPTNFKDLLIKATDLLIDDHLPDYNSSRYKGYERLCGMMYHQLVNAMRAHRAQGSMTNVGVTMNPKAVWLDILQDPTVSIVEQSNPIHNLKEHEAFTHSGAGGRSTVTMTKDTRGFGIHDVGVVSESTPDSSKVGIRAYLTANPNITSIRGTTKSYDPKTDGPSSAISTSALLSPCVTHDDAKRVNYISVQHSHGVACPGYTPLPYRTGYEEVIGSRVDELFVVTAEEAGIVKVVKPNILTVEYYKPNSKPIAVIVKGNEKYITDKTIKPMADKFYNEVKKILEAKGYAVEFDRGLAYTSPRGDARVWLGHSMGVDRLQYAPKGITTLEIKSLSPIPVDKKLYDQNGSNPKHYQLSDDDIKNINALQSYSESDLACYSKSYELGIFHGTVTGTTVPHTRVTDLKVGHKFKKGDALVFNSGFFTRSELNPNNVVYKAGVMSRIALLENSDTIEDGCVITENLASKLTTPKTELHGVIVDFNTIIHNLVKVGDHVEPETILCTLESYTGGNGEVKDAEAIKALSRIAANNPKAKVYGKISEIQVLYFGKIEDMHFSLQKIVEEYDSARAKHVKQFMTTDAKTGKIDEPIRVANKKVTNNQVAIKIFIDGELAAGTGDKLVFGNALKSTISRVATDPIRTNSGEEVDGLFGYQSVSDRIVLSPEISGLMNSIMIALSKRVGTMYKK